MSRQSRDLKEELDWLRKYAAEATILILDYKTALERTETVGQPPSQISSDLAKRVSRLRAACRVWDEVQKLRKEFKP